MMSGGVDGLESEATVKKKTKNKKQNKKTKTKLTKEH